MKLSDYFDLQTLVKRHGNDKAALRTFGLAHASLFAQPPKLLHVWMREHIRKENDGTTPGEHYARPIADIAFWSNLVACIFGLTAAFALLHYNGKEPVNLLYYLFAAVALPLLTMIGSVAAMVRAMRTHSAMVRFSPAYWLQRILGFLHKEKETRSYRIDPLLGDWIAIRRAQSMGVCYGIGILAGLLVTITLHDVAFVWSTTLAITPDAFERFVKAVAFPWRDWMPQAVPSAELIAQSRYFRLGGEIDPEMVAKAQRLGEWWPFLAMATAVYTIGLRMLLWAVAYVGYAHALRKAVLRIEGVEALLEAMREPTVRTGAEHPNRSVGDSLSHREAEATRAVLKGAYDIVVGWACEKEKLPAVAESVGTSASRYIAIEGSETYEEKRAELQKISGEALFLVKGWEPPISEFADMLEVASEYAEAITVVPVGLPPDYGIADERWLSVWRRWLQMQPIEKTEVI